MTKRSDKDYFAKAQSWAIESDEKLQRSRRRAWIVAGVAAAIALMQAIAIFMLLPLKTTETVMLLVDKTTGYVQRINPESANDIRADDALIQSLLAQYVGARERYDRSTVQADYRKTALWSSGAARKTYIADMNSSNPGSPVNRYPPGDSRQVEIKSISQISKGQALVRFDTFLVGRDGQRVPDGSWISLVEYQFANAPMNYEDRLTNPLGIQVSKYRRDAERPSQAPSVVQNINIRETVTNQNFPNTANTNEAATVEENSGAAQ